jgi:transcriptional regulator with XRE-family HTH domain
MSTPGFGALLRQYREAALVTQEELADRSGLSIRAISNLETGRTGRPFRTSAECLARALGLDGASTELLMRAARAGRVRAAPARSSQASLRWAGHQAAAAAPRLPVPRQLPASPAFFTGREPMLKTLNATLDQVLDGTVATVALVGTAGIGKTTLALHWAHQVADCFADGQLYVDLCGFSASKPVQPPKAIRGFLEALEIPAAQIPADLDEQAALYRSVLAGKRMLILLDNARDASQVRPLLAGSPGCLVLITSRSQLGGLAVADGARLLVLDLLSESESRDLLVCRLGPERVLGAPEATDDLARLCARLPMALSIAATRASATPGLPLTALVGELADAGGRLDALDAGDPAADLRVVLSWSYRRLGPSSARMFRLLGLHPGPDIGLPAAASLAGVRLPQARRALRDLVRAHLAAEQVAGRYAFHDLLRAYSVEMVQQVDSQPDRDAAVLRMVDHYLHSAWAANRMLNPAWDSVTMTRCAAGVRPEQPADYEDALSWFRAERQVLPSVLGLAASAGLDVPGLADSVGSWRTVLAAPTQQYSRDRPAEHAGRPRRHDRALWYQNHEGRPSPGRDGRAEINL